MLPPARCGNLGGTSWRSSNIIAGGGRQLDAAIQAGWCRGLAGFGFPGKVKNIVIRLLAKHAGYEGGA